MLIIGIYINNWQLMNENVVEVLHSTGKDHTFCRTGGLWCSKLFDKLSLIVFSKLSDIIPVCVDSLDHFLWCVTSVSSGYGTG